MVAAEFELGAWLQPYVEFRSPQDVHETMSRARDAGLSLLLPCVKSESHFTDGRSMAYYNSALLEQGVEWDMLDCLCREAEAAEMELHAWVCTFLEGGSKLLRERPDLESLRFSFTHKEVPTGMACPASEEVRAAEIAFIEEIARGYPVSGIHLDFVRYAELRACSCERCRNGFTDRTGFAPEEIMRSGAARKAWLEMRVETISSFVREIKRIASSHGKRLSAAVFPEYPAIADICGQDWVKWLKEGWLDLAITMNYTSTASEFLRRAAEHKALGLPEGELMEGIGKRTEKVSLRSDELMTQVQIARGMGAAGAVFFSMGALDDEDLRQLAKVGTRKGSSSGG